MGQRVERLPASGGYHQQAEEVQPPRLMQRPKDVEDTSRGVLDRPPPKSMKQKEAEYAAARARIFGSKAGPQSGGRGAQATAGRGRGPATVGQGRPRVAESGRGGNSAPQRSSGGGGPPRRRGNDDDGDPDYDRNPAKYGARLAPEDNYVEESEDDYLAEPMPRESRQASAPMPRESRYQPPTYEAEFPALGR